MKFESEKMEIETRAHQRLLKVYIYSYSSRKMWGKVGYIQQVRLPETHIRMQERSVLAKRIVHIGTGNVQQMMVFKRGG